MENNLITTIVEALDASQRRARGRLMKRLAPKIARKRKLLMKRKASTEKLETRARKAAINVLRKKMLKDRSYDSLTPAAKEKVDEKIAKKKAVIDKLAKKLLPKIKKAEKERIASKREE